MIRLFATLLALASSELAQAHPEIEGALNRLNAQLAATPDSADLYMERGELYARHEEWVMAEANYLRASELAPDHPRLSQLRGALELATGRPAEALIHLHAALAREEKNPEALVLRARAQVGIGRTTAALEDLNTALKLIATPPPELYLERAKLLPPAEAVRSLDEGIERVGPAITLHLAALALEESLGRIDDAVARLDRLTSESERKDPWLKRRGDVLLRAGRASEARAAYRSAYVALSSLPDWLRDSPEAKRLSAELAQLLQSRS